MARRSGVVGLSLGVAALIAGGCSASDGAPECGPTASCIALHEPLLGQDAIVRRYIRSHPAAWIPERRLPDTQVGSVACEYREICQVALADGPSRDCTIAWRAREVIRSAQCQVYD